MHRVDEMLFILKTQLLAPSPKKWDVYQTRFQMVFKGRNLYFDQLFNLIGAFYNAYKEFLKPEALITRLNEDGAD
jgi:hypothetical protein